MKYPRFIKPNDTISLVAPSFGIEESPYLDRYQEAIKKWKEFSYLI